MPVEFRKVSCPPITMIDAIAPDGAAIGIIGEDGAGTSTLLRLAGGLEPPHGGSVAVGAKHRFLGPTDPLNFAPVDTLLLDHTLAFHDRLVRTRAIMALDRLRQSGTTILFTSHEEDLLLELADEIWWLRDGRLIGRGDPAEALDAYRTHIGQRIRAWGESIQSPLSPRLRQGDGRAQILGVEIAGEDGKPTSVLRSGEAAMVRVSVKYSQSVADPVIGILLRTQQPCQRVVPGGTINHSKPPCRCVCAQHRRTASQPRAMRTYGSICASPTSTSRALPPRRSTAPARMTCGCGPPCQRCESM